MRQTNDTPTSFSSKDFVRTKASILVDMPERLIHRGVEQSSSETEFSSERKHPVHVVDLPTKTISMTIGGLLPSQGTNRHRHAYETVIFILEGTGSTFIEDREVSWKAGDAIYVPVWAWHHHVNASGTDSCRYIACENMPLLQNLGGLALREEC